MDRRSEARFPRAWRERPGEQDLRVRDGRAQRRRALDANRYATTQFISHEKANHHIYEYFRKPDITTNTIESYFALLKRGVHGTFHHVSRKYLGQYLGEFDFRYNHRKIEDGPRTEIAIGMTRGKRLMRHGPLAMQGVSR